MKSWIIAVLILCVASTAPAASLYYWTDADGVKHISDRVPVEDADVEIMEVKDPNRDGLPNSDASAALNRMYQQIRIDEYHERIDERRRDAERQWNQRAHEAETQSKKRDREWELDRARDEASSYQENKDRYRQNENNAKTEESRLRWQEMNKKGEEAERRLMELENQ